MCDFLSTGISISSLNLMILDCIAVIDWTWLFLLLRFDFSYFVDVLWYSFWVWLSYKFSYNFIHNWWYEYHLKLLWCSIQINMFHTETQPNWIMICILSKSHVKKFWGPQRFCRSPNSLHMGFTFLMDTNTSKYFYNLSWEWSNL